MPTLTDFEELLDDADGGAAVLLGNGFSIACDPRFQYGRLLDESDFGSAARTDRLGRVFAALGTADFELVTRHLQGMPQTLTEYPGTAEAIDGIDDDASAIPGALADAISTVHPDRIDDVGEDRLEACNRFIKRFSSVFTLNYDLLLYWARLRDAQALDDGFRRDGTSLVYSRADAQSVYFLHGALHLTQIEVPGRPPRVVKAEWGGEEPLVDQIRHSLTAGEFPLIVMEGTWQQKQAKIESSPYLRGGFDALRSLDGSVFTYGWSISDNDSHVLGAIEASRIEQVNVGIYGELEEAANAAIVGQAEAMRARSNNRIDIRYWDVSTVPVWNT